MMAFPSSLLDAFYSDVIYHSANLVMVEVYCGVVAP